MTGGEFLLQTLSDQGLDHVFLVPGGHIDPLVTELGKGVGLKPIVAAQEEGAGFMADGYARVSGHFSACLGIGGPGAANILAAAVAARSDGARVLFITGDVPTNVQGRGAFQDGSFDGTRDAEFLRPATVFSEEVEVARELRRQLAAAFRAMFGVPSGPAHLSVPSDVLTASATAEPDVPAVRWEAARPVDAGTLADVAEKMLAGASKLAVLAGRGCVISGAGEEIRAFAETFEVPVATTFAAKGVLPYDHRLALGLFGYAGTHRAITALLVDDLDVLLVLGSSMNLRDTLYWSRELTGRRKVVQIDIAATTLGRDYAIHRGVIGDCRETLLLSYAGGPLQSLAASATVRKSWAASLKAVPAFYDAENLNSDAAPVHPARLIAEMRRVLPRETILFVDSGAHRAFADHYWQSHGPGGVRSATNLGPMGWAIPAAIGGKLAKPASPVVVSPATAVCECTA